MILDAIIVVKRPDLALLVQRFVKPGVMVVAPGQQLAGRATKKIILTCDLIGYNDLETQANENWYSSSLACRLVPEDVTARPEPPVFTKPVCRGSLVLGSACGHCERCDWERSKGGF